MARAVVACLLLIFLCTSSCMEIVGAQSTKGKTSWDIITEMETLSRAVEGLQAKIDGQAALLNNLRTKEEIQANALNGFEEKLTALENLLGNIETKGDEQANSLSTLEAELKSQNNLLNNLQVSTAAMQVNLRNIFEEKFNLLANMVNNVITEDQNLKAKVDTQTSLLSNLQAGSNSHAALLAECIENQKMQATSLSGLEAGFTVHKNLLNNFEGTATRQTNLLKNLETKADLQATLLANLQAQSDLQTTSLNTLVAEAEWHEPVAQENNRTIVALAGDDAKIWCVVRGTPLPEIRWTRENATLLESDRVAVENNGKTLRIKNVQINDEGSYECVAANGVGTPASQSVSLEVYGKYRQCTGMFESDKGNLEIERTNSSCVSVIKLRNTTGFRLELDPLMTESILVIPEQNASNPNAQSIWISGSKNVSSYEFDGKKLAIVVLPGRDRITFNWRGLAANVSEIKSTRKFVNDYEGTLEWEPIPDGNGKIFWEFSHEMHVELNWTLNTYSAVEAQENPCENMLFYVMQIRPDGSISAIQKTCDGSSEGSLKLERHSEMLVLLHMKSVEATRSKLRVSWTQLDEPLKKTVDGIVAGTWSHGAHVILFDSAQTKAVLSGDIRGLTFDWNSRGLYYLNSGLGIMRCNLNGSESKILVSDPSSNLRGMTIEPTSGNFYYGNRSSRTIRICNNDVTKCSTIANSSDLSSIRDFAVHPSKGLLFWSITDQKIVRANLDGSNATVILERKVRGIDVDEHE